MLGRRFGRLKVIGEARAIRYPSGQVKLRVRVKCACGTKKIVQAADLRSGRVIGCGCVHSEGLAKRNYRHGHGIGKRSGTFRTWSGMLSRCRNANQPHYKNYGGRGIRVCKRWLVFTNFLADMGRRPKGKTIDRKNVNGNYTPKNCRWATDRQQSLNKRKRSKRGGR